MSEETSSPQLIVEKDCPIEGKFLRSDCAGPTKFQREAQEDYLYSLTNDDSYYYEQCPPHWKN